MRAIVIKPRPEQEQDTKERCFILEAWNDASDPAVSIARARVLPGVTTQRHRLHGVIERYLIISGYGVVRIGDSEAEVIGPGDVVLFPAGVSQQVTNTGEEELIFYCICTPRWTPDCYEALED